MTITNETKLRRHILKVLGGGAVLAPFLSITACSGEKNPPPDSAPDSPGSTDTPEPPQVETPAEGSGDTTMPRLTEDDPQAASLNYVEDATRVDGAKFAQYQAGQTCANCALFLAEEGSEFGPCSIFAGKLVAAAGWCSVYVPKA